MTLNKRLITQPGEKGTGPQVVNPGTRYPSLLVAGPGTAKLRCLRPNQRVVRINRTLQMMVNRP